MDIITALKTTLPSLAARCNIPPCDAVTEHVPGDASLNKALSIVFEWLLDQSTFSGRLTVIDTALEAWQRNWQLFLQRIADGEKLQQSPEAWKELIRVLNRWRDKIVDDSLTMRPCSIESMVLKGPIVAVDFAKEFTAMVIDPDWFSPPSQRPVFV